MKQFLRRLKWLFERTRREADLESELEFHLATEAEERQAGGMPEDEAESAARRELGNVTLVKEDTRAVWGWVVFEHALQDLRYGLRGLRKNRAFTATAVLSLALGIGANTAIFSLLDALLLRWLPVRDPQELIQLKFRTAGSSTADDSFSYPLARALAEQTDIFAALTAFSGSTFNVGPAGSATQVSGALVTGAYYETLGLHPVLGRLLTPADDQIGAAPVAVISYGYWERRYSHSVAAVGKTMRINGVPVTIVGVSPPGFVGANVGTVAEITVALGVLGQVDPEAVNLLGAGNFWLRILARPKSGISSTAARGRLALVWPRICERALSPRWPADRKLSFSQARLEFARGGTGWTYLREQFERPLLVLMAMVGLVLLIACANVANLLLARATARHREIAVRLAMGASRARVIRQFVTESILLAALGGAIGIALAFVTSRWLVDVLSTGSEQIVFDLTPNWHVLAFTAAVALGAGMLFGVIPAVRATDTGLSSGLKEEGKLSRSRMLSWLVAVQMAVSVVLLMGAGLFVRTLQNLESVDPGFRREGVLLVDLEGRRTSVPQHLLADIARIRGVVAASVSTHAPLSGSIWSEPAVPHGQAIPENDTAYFSGVGPDFFDTLQIPLVEGRGFTERDSGPIPTVAVVNQAFARKFFPNADALGQFVSAIVNGRHSELQVVGVVKNVDLAGLRKAAPPAVYVSYYQMPTHDDSGKKTNNFFPATIEIRAAGSLSEVAVAIRNHLQPRMRDEPLDIHSLSSQVEATLVQERLVALLGGIFGGLALVLAFAGVYGLLAYRVARSTKEVGIRMALGAERAQIIRRILMDAFGMALGGIALGLPAAFAASQLVKSMLFGLTATDQATVIGSIVLLMVATAAAAYLPGQRAARVDPMTALRHE